MPNLASAYVQIIPTTKGIKDSLTNELSGGASEAGSSAGAGFAGTLKKVIVAAGIGTVVTKVLKASLDAGGELQQSFGGLDTLYGDAADAAKNYAYEAAKAGISANDYAEQAVSFGAGLKQAFGGDTTKAVEAANIAILDMADNAAKMGTPIESIQNAYQGFAKSNYTMLDNLKLGYGGTKTEMERLLADATKLTGVKYDISNLGDVYEAIHVIQDDLGLTGVAAQEAGETFTGSFGSMKAAATNLLANMSLGEDIQEPLWQLRVSVNNFLFNNLFPMVGRAISSLPDVLGGALATISSTIFGIVENAGQITKMGLNLVTGLARSIISAAPYFIAAAFELVSSFANALLSTDWVGTATQFVSDIKDDLSFAAGEIFGSEDGVSMFDALKDALGNIDWAGAAENALNILKGGLTANRDLVTGAFSTIGHGAIELFKAIDWAGLGDAVISLVQGGIEFAQDFIPQTIETIGNTAKDLFESVEWGTAGTSIIIKLSEAINLLLTSIPDLLFSIGESAKSLFESVDWAGAGSTLISLITTGMSLLIDNIGVALKAIGDSAKLLFESIDWAAAGSGLISLITTGMGLLVDNIPTALKFIAEKAVEWFNAIPWAEAGSALITFITSGMEELVDNIPAGLEAIGNTAVELFNAIPWLDAGSALITAITSGMATLVSNIPTALKAIGSTALGWFAGIKWLQGGKNVITSILSGITLLVKSIPNKLKEIGQDAWNAIKNIKWADVGQAIIDGIVQGLKDFGANIATTAKGIVDSAKQSVMSFFGIGSPSKVFRDDIGRWLAAGIGVGFEQYMPVDSMISTIKGVTSTVARATQSAVLAMPNISATASVIPGNNPEVFIQAMVNQMVAGTQRVADGVQKGIGNMKMVSNNRETARFIADLGFQR